MSSLKKNIRLFLMKHPKLRVGVRKAHVQGLRLKYKWQTKGVEIENTMVLFETFMGRQYGCNPKAIYEEMLLDDRFKEFSFVWVLKDQTVFDDIPNDGRTTYVIKNSAAYYKFCAMAKYVITNSNMDYGITKRNGQIMLQTWHGTPLKKLRCDIDIEGNVLNSLAEIRQKNDLDVIRYDYFLSPSRFATEKFISAFNLKNLGKSDIVIETGYPRNDFLFKYDCEKVLELKNNLRLPMDKKIILYAPTFRDNQHDGEGYTYDLHIDFDKLKRAISDEYIILFRAHYFVANQFDFAKFDGFVYDVSSIGDITPLYTISDMLITDYSSVFFDFANLKRQMLFYMYDLDEYKKGIRGFYIDIDELPGPILKTEDELIEAIKANSFEYDYKYEIFNKKYNTLDDGNASRRVIDILLSR